MLSILLFCGILNILFLKFQFSIVHCCCCWVTSVVSDSVRPHRWQPTRLPHPWDSPGKNIRVGCHFILQCMKVKRESEIAQSCLTLSDPIDCSLPGSSIHGIFKARVLEWGAIAFSKRMSSRYQFNSFRDLNTVSCRYILNIIYTWSLHFSLSLCLAGDIEDELVLYLT